MAKKPKSPSRKVVKKRPQPPKSKQTAGNKSSTPPVKKVVTTSLPEENISRPLSKKAQATRKSQSQLPLGRMNYILLAVGVGLIALGFFLMSLDDFVDATKFSVSLHIAPIIVVGGFIEVIYAIMYKSKADVGPSDELVE